MALALETLVRKKINLDNNWDPTKLNGDEVPSSKTSHRIFMDVMECVNADANVIVLPDSKNVLIVHCVIVGPEKTPYEGGFFYFFVKFPANYPISPPRVKLMNTDQNSIRFNQNFYKNGMICLNILGTYIGPGWNPLNTLFSVILSIRSLMYEDPIQIASSKTTGFTASMESDYFTPDQYIHYLRYETMRVAVINFMKEENSDTTLMPVTMREKINKIFEGNIPFYCKTITDNMVLHNADMFDPFNFSVRGQKFDYESLKTNMGELAKKHQIDAERDAFTVDEFDGAVGGMEDFGEQSECSDLSDPDTE